MSFGKGVIEIRRVSKIDPTSRHVLTLDMILVTDAIRNVWETRLRATLEGGKLSVVSRDGLVTLKQISGRPQDLADIFALTEDADAGS